MGFFIDKDKNLYQKAKSVCLFDFVTGTLLGPKELKYIWTTFIKQAAVLGRLV